MSLAAQVGAHYSLDKRWRLLGSIARVDVKSKLVATGSTGSTVLQTTIDFKPVTVSFGALCRL